MINQANAENIKLILLALVLAVIPSFEAPKNILVFLFVSSWIYFSWTSKYWGGKWKSIDTVFAVYILLDLMVGLNAFLVHDQPFRGSIDILRFILVGWVVSRVQFTNKKMINLSLIAVFSTILPLLFIISECNVSKCIELNSVGHVNHTSIYLLIMFILSYSILFFSWKQLDITKKLFLFASSVFLMYAILQTNSRATSFTLFGLLILSLVYLNISKKSISIILISLIFLATSVASLLSFQPSVVKKFINEPIMGDTPRHRIRQFSYYVFQLDPILGTGMDNFPNFDVSHIKEKVIEDKGVFKIDEIKLKQQNFTRQPHNIYYAYLTGGGVVLLTIFLIFWMTVILNSYKLRHSSQHRWLVASSISMTIVFLLIGAVNNSFANENALISMVIIGFLFSTIRREIK